MKIFQCGHCGHPLFFENMSCEQCGHIAGFNPVKGMMNTFASSQNGLMISDRLGNTYKYCKNHEHRVCNWLVLNPDEDYCEACKLNRTIPNLSDGLNYEKWKRLEIAKHRLIYQLIRLGLPLTSNSSEPVLRFDFLSKKMDNSVMTGHANGVITIVLSEADSVLREQMRKQMSEPYRTLIGHFRHEIGHYYWDILIKDNADILDQFRALFGDERMHYGTALTAYYQQPKDLSWKNAHISKYATAHPWEDWAETWAHYLHIMDMTETAYYFGIKSHPQSFPSMQTIIDFDPYLETDFDQIIQQCVPLLFAVNSMNRSMGIPDVYPFVINKAVTEKMHFIHNLLMSRAIHS